MKKILIVDDQPNIRKLIRLTLAERFVLVEAEDGEAAIAAVRREKPDIVLLDVMMPGAYDGFQVLEWIKGNPEYKNTFVVMVTARGQTNDYEAGMRSGADAYFIKPFSPMQLISFLTEQCP